MNTKYARTVAYEYLPLIRHEARAYATYRNQGADPLYPVEYHGAWRAVQVARHYMHLPFWSCVRLENEQHYPEISRRQNTEIAAQLSRVLVRHAARVGEAINRGDHAANLEAVTVTMTHIFR